MGGWVLHCGKLGHTVTLNSFSKTVVKISSLGEKDNTYSIIGDISMLHSYSRKLSYLSESLCIPNAVFMAFLVFVYSMQHHVIKLVVIT